MQELQCIFIVDANGTLFFVRELFVEGSEGAYNALLKNFVATLQKFSKEIGGDVVKMIKLGNAKIYSIKDIRSNIYFVIKADSNANDKKVFNLLNSIRDIFQQIFTETFPTNTDEKRVLFDKFRQELDNLLNPLDKISNFLSNL